MNKSKTLILSTIALTSIITSVASAATSNEFTPIYESISEIEAFKSSKSHVLQQSIDDLKSQLENAELLNDDINTATQTKNDLELKVKELTSARDASTKKSEENKKKISELNDKVKSLQEQLAKKKAEEEKAKEEAERLAEEEAQRQAEEARLAEEAASQLQMTQETQSQPVATPQSSASTHEYSLSQFQFLGVVNWGGYKFTYYSQSV